MLRNYKITIMINVIALMAILFDLSVIFNGQNSLFDADYVFALYFLSAIYLVTFIHAFLSIKIKDKIKIVLLDMIPIFLFGVLVVISEEQNLKTILKDISLITSIFYLVGSLTILILNYIIHRIYITIKTKNVSQK